jgi:hypothetical protein
LISLRIPKLVRFAKSALQQFLWYFHTKHPAAGPGMTPASAAHIAAIYCAAIEEMWSL